ncbi:MAG: RNA-binding protein [Gammaproteobacteria bacterium]|nr:RNA-binding protein [Gammaproteobacteria bacterium]
MPSKILVSNLPPGTTAEEIVEMFKKWGADVAVDIEGESERLTAVVNLDVDAKTARIMVDRAKDLFYKGRTLSFYAPLMMNDEN